MEELIQEQRNALKNLCDRLNERKVAAKIEETGERMLLTVFLPQTEQEYFTDIFFFPQEERMEQISFCCMRTVIRDLTGIKDEDVLGFCRRISEQNGLLPIGGYGIERTEDGLHLKTQVFSATRPVDPVIRGEKLTDTMEDTLALIVQTIAQTVPELQIPV